ncbi:MAG: hypothetical protein DIU74_007740, partial [Pseudomonadota bacterium]
RHAASVQSEPGSNSSVQSFNRNAIRTAHPQRTDSTAHSKEPTKENARSRTLPPCQSFFV